MFRLHFELECGACERACTMNRHRKARRTERWWKMYTLIKVVWTPAALGPGCDPRPGSHCWAYSVIPHSQTGQAASQTIWERRMPRMLWNLSHKLPVGRPSTWRWWDMPRRHGNCVHHRSRKGYRCTIICTHLYQASYFDTFWFFWMWRVSVCADRLCWPHAAGHEDCRMWQLPNSTVSGLGFWSWCGCSFVQHHTFLLSISCFAALVRYVSAHGRIFICCGCHCANRIPLEVGRTEVPCRCFQHTISTVVQKDEKLPVIYLTALAQRVMSWKELIVPEGPLKKFEFKKGGENYWQEPIVCYAFVTSSG